MENKVGMDLARLLAKGYAVEIYTTITGRVRAGAVVEPSTLDCWRAENASAWTRCGTATRRWRSAWRRRRCRPARHPSSCSRTSRSCVRWSTRDTDTPPFDLNLKDGRWVGCGVYGDKGPLIVNLFALRELRDANVTLARPLVLLVGTQLSTPGAGIASSLAVLKTPPALVLAVDGTFPYSAGQMGNLWRGSRRGAA